MNMWIVAEFAFLRHNGGMSEPGGNVEQADVTRQYDDFFPEGEVSYTLAEVIRENRLGGNIVDFGRRIFMLAVSSYVSGIYQYQGEIYKITGIDAGEDPMKFPGGVSSINFAEEVIEAGTFSAAGAIAGLYLGKLLRNKEGEHMSLRDECICVVAGSFAGNAMLSLLGGLAHQLSNSPDFPTMEYIQKILGG